MADNKFTFTTQITKAYQKDVADQPCNVAITIGGNANNTIHDTIRDDSC